MKIVHVTTVPLSLRFLRGQIGFLQSKNVDVHVISSPSPDLEAFAKEYQVVSHGVELQRKISPLRDLWALGKLILLLRKMRPQIVHAHTPKAGLLGMMAARIAGVPLRVYHIHGLPLVTARGIKRFLLRICDTVACRFAHQVYCVSPSICEIVENKRICQAEKMAVLENGSIDGIDSRFEFNPNRLKPGTLGRIRRSLGISPQAMVVGFVGRIVRDKGIRELLDAWQRLRKEFSDLHLLVVGPLESRSGLTTDIISTLQNDPRIHLVGYTKDLAPFYLAMDVLAFPTYREGFGLVALEAAAMERPVVATRIPGCVDAVQDGVTGTLIPPYNALALRSAIRRYLKDPELRHLHGIAGRKRAEQDFQPWKIWNALWQGYLGKLDQKRELLVEVAEPIQQMKKAA